MTSNIVVFDRCCLPADTNYTVSAGVVGAPYPTISPPFVWTINDPNLGCKVDTNGLVAGAVTNGTITVRALDTNTGCYAEGTIDLCDLGATTCQGSCGPDSVGPGSNNGSGPGAGGGGGGGGSGGADGSDGSGGSGASGGTIGSTSGTLSTSGGLSISMAMGMTTGALPLTSAGSIRSGAAVPSWTLYSPASLFFYYAVTAVAVITNNNGIVQVHSPDGLGNVVTNSSTNSYEVDFYAPSNVTGFSGGLYLFTNSPFATVTISNPDNGTTNNRVRVTAVKDSVTSVYDFVYTNSAWQLTSGGGLRTESVSVTATNGIRTLTRQLLSSGSVIYKNVKQFQTFSWGEGLIEEDIGTGPSALTNSYSYYTNGLLQQVNHANGSWEYYVYDDQRRATNVFSAFGNQAPTTDRSLCRMIEYNFSTNVVAGLGDPGTTDIFTPRRTVEYLLGQEISRSYAVRNWGSQADYRCQTAGAGWGASDNLITSSTTYTDGVNFGKPKSTWRNDSFERWFGDPDGTYDLYYYDYGPNGITTNYSASGAPDYNHPTSIVHGSSNITVIGASGELLSQTTMAVYWDMENWSNYSVITNDFLGNSNFDGYHRALQRTYLDGSLDYTFYDCCNLDIFTNREGTVTTYGYDALKRRITTSVNGITLSNKLDGAGNVLAVVRYGTNGTSMTLRSATYDDAGRVKTSTDAVGNVTSYTNFFDSNGFLVRKTILPNGAITTNMYYRDGLLYKVSGSAVFPKSFIYGVDSDGGGLTSAYRLEQRETTNEWVKTFTDMIGRQYKTVYATASGSHPYTQNYYNSVGQLYQSRDLDGTATSYTYNDINEVAITALDPSGINRLTGMGGDYTQHGSVDVRRRLTTNYPSGSPIIASVMESSTDGHTTWNDSFGLTNVTTTFFAGNGIRLTTNTAPDGSFTISSNYNALLMSVNRFDANGGQIFGTSYGYDAHGRRNTVTDARCGTTTYLFDSADRVTSLTTPSPSQTTSNLYNNLGQIWKTILPDNTFITNGYFDNGLLKQTYGSRTYPVAYKYDSQGRMTNMTTWTNFVANQGAATTTWKYDGYRGFMTNKVYADGNGPSYLYTNSGKILQRKWARGVTTSYGYNSAGDLITTVYSDGTPNVTNSVLDGLGRPTTIRQGTNATALYYTDSGDLFTEIFNGVSVVTVYDSLRRRITNGVMVGINWLTMTTNSYDAASRLLVVSDGTNSATYSYLTNSSLVSQILFQQSGTTRMTTTKQYDNLNRLLAITNLPSADSAISFNYVYNSANQRTSVTNADGSRWIYQYDSLGQMISGKKYWSDGTPVAGQQFEYGYDDIGNRKFAGSGGDQWGANLRYENYTVNNLNQFTQRTVPAAVDILGAASSNATVTVNNTATYRRAEYFRNQFPVSNGSGPVYQSFTNLAVLANGTNADVTATNRGSLFVPLNPESFGCDLDGNITNDGRWSFAWDAENRVIQIASSNDISAANCKLQLAYDYESRRVQKRSFTWNLGWDISYDNRLIYDGRNLVAELNSTNAARVNSFIWGPVLYSRMEPTGGSGGLMVLVLPSGACRFAAYSGVGDRAALINSADGGCTAHYEFAFFGELLLLQGEKLDSNPSIYAGMYRDNETEMDFSGRMLFRPNLGRWVSRNPGAERDGCNLFAPIADDRFRSHFWGRPYLRDRNQMDKNLDQNVLWADVTTKELPPPLPSKFHLRCENNNPGYPCPFFYDCIGFVKPGQPTDPVGLQSCLDKQRNLWDIGCSGKFFTSLGRICVAFGKCYDKYGPGEEPNYVPIPGFPYDPAPFSIMPPHGGR